MTHVRADRLAICTKVQAGPGPTSLGRLHDLSVNYKILTPKACKNKGAGLKIAYGFHGCPFGQVLLMVSGHSLVGLAFADEGDEELAFQDLSSRWPNADYINDPSLTAPFEQRIFDPEHWPQVDRLKVILIGTEFQINVWKILLQIPVGRTSTYAKIAEYLGKPFAWRAVGSAIGRNPVSFIVPCHRVLGKSGALCGYHWGITRKQAILGWEAELMQQGQAI